jgi:hypothetical protein
MSSETRPSKVTSVDPKTIRANEIAIENSKNGKVTAVVSVIYLIREGKCKLRRANPKFKNRPENLSHETDKKSSVLLDDSRNLRRTSQKSRNKFS